MKLAVILIACLLLGGCVAAEDFWEKEIQAVYTPDSLREKNKRRMAETLDYFLRKSKDERIRVIGAPDKCTGLNTGEEICAWTAKASSSEQHITYTYDKDGIARSWSYRGALGQFTNANYHLAPSTSASSDQPAPQPQTGWVHPAKAKEAFSQDYLECQTDLSRDPKAQQRIAMYVEYAIESCMKQKGWIDSGKR